MISGPRTFAREIKKTTLSQDCFYKTDHEVNTFAKCELDTRVDKICAGRNFRALAYTGQSCDVKGFHDSFDSLKNIPVAQVATAIQRDGRTFVLIINEALYFGSSMDHSLINPNQIQSYGIPVCDDPYDKARDFGISHDDLFLPFDTCGSTVFFETFVPSDDDLINSTQIVLTDGDHEWDPGTVKLSQVTRDSVCVSEHPCKSDEILGSICPTIVSSLMNSRIINSVKIQAPSVTARRNITSKTDSQQISEVLSKTQHSVITPEHISRVFNVGIDKAKTMLAVTMQRGICTAVTPIFRKYRVDHLNLHVQHLKRSGTWIGCMLGTSPSLSAPEHSFTQTGTSLKYTP